MSLRSLSHGKVSLCCLQVIPAWWILGLIMSEKVLQSSTATFFSLEFRFSSCLFVETSRIRSVSRESVRFEAKWSKMLGQIVGNRSWQKLPDLRLKWEQIPWSSCPVFVAMEAFTFRKWSLVPLIDFGQMFVTCLVTWKPNKLIVLWSSVFGWFFMLSYAF